MMNTVLKGDIAELAVASDLTKRGYRVAFPFGSSQDWDLLLIRNPQQIERVQVKYAAVKNGTFRVRAYVTTHTGRTEHEVRSYDQEMLDWLAVYCPDKDSCFYLPMNLIALSSGNQLELRVEEPKIKTDPSRIRWASDFTRI